MEEEELESFTLEDIYTTLDCPLSEPQLWAFLTQTLSKFKPQLETLSFEELLKVRISPLSLALFEDGTVQIIDITEDQFSEDYVAPECIEDEPLSLTTLEKSLTYSIGGSIYSAADYNLGEDEEPDFSEDLEGIIEHMTADDLDERITLEEVLQICANQDSEDSLTVCQKLFEEIHIMKFVNDKWVLNKKKVVKKPRQENQIDLFDILKKEICSGFELRKLTPEDLRKPERLPETPHEKLLDQICKGLTLRPIKRKEEETVDLGKKEPIVEAVAKNEKKEGGTEPKEVAEAIAGTKEKEASLTETIETEIKEVEPEKTQIPEAEELEAENEDINIDEKQENQGNNLVEKEESITESEMPNVTVNPGSTETLTNDGPDKVRKLGRGSKKMIISTSGINVDIHKITTDTSKIPLLNETPEEPQEERAVEHLPVSSIVPKQPSFQKKSPQLMTKSNTRRSIRQNRKSRAHSNFPDSHSTPKVSPPTSTNMSSTHYTSPSPTISSRESKEEQNLQSKTSSITRLPLQPTQQIQPQSQQQRPKGRTTRNSLSGNGNSNTVTAQLGLKEARQIGQVFRNAVMQNTACESPELHDKIESGKLCWVCKESTFGYIFGKGRECYVCLNLACKACTNNFDVGNVANANVCDSCALNVLHKRKQDLNN